MIPRLFNTCLCRPEDIRPSQEDMEVIGTFNPGAALLNEEILLMIRVAERPRERRSGYAALPRWQDKTGIVVDWVPDDQLIPLDPRIVQSKTDGLTRLNFISHIRILHCGDGRTVQHEDPIRFEPQGPFETFGIEDPRITCLDGIYWITYVAVSSHGPATALASTRDFRSFQRHGIIFPVENKDVVLFPQRTDGDYVALHRPRCATPFAHPEIWLARSTDLRHWGQHQVLRGGVSTWDAGRVGAGPPPLRTTDGWLEIYHGGAKRRLATEVGAYSAAAMLLDPEQPHCILRQSEEPILIPQARFETEGFVPNVVFPTGIIDRGSTLQIYYGAADTVTAVVELATADILTRNLRLVAG